MRRNRKSDLMKWAKQNTKYMTAPGCEVILGNYDPKTDMRQLAGFLTLGRAKKAIKEMGLEDEDYVILYNTSLPDTTRFNPKL